MKTAQTLEGSSSHSTISLLGDSLDRTFQNYQGFSPYTELSDFMSEAEACAFLLPLKLQIAVRNFYNFGNEQGYLLITDLKQDPVLPAIADDGSIKKQTFLSEFWLGTLACLLGAPFSYVQEGQGNLFHDVRPTAKNAHRLSSESSKINLDLHTETAFHPFVMDYLGLYCLRQDHEKVAGTVVSSSREFLPLLDPADREALFQPEFATGVDYSFGNGNSTRGNGRVIPILTGAPEDPLMIFDPDLMEGRTPRAQKALLALKKAADQTLHSLYLKPGEMLIIDNRRAVHGRTPFTARYDGNDRWLQRVYITRNLRMAEEIFNRKERIITHQF